ncbi:MAG: nucleoside deaminase [Synergistaceae bacterium]|jgi:tRNA(Arg) A34 adenosine deaminase TadA|nr:nucleoside deaminase [Synergistaceae bacterium]
MNGTEKLQRLLDIVRDEIIPLSESEIQRGNHIFGSAIVRADTLTSVMVGSDNRVENPLFHGEIDALNRFFKLPVRPSPKELIFLSINDPCPMCASAIAWAGFEELWVLFETKDAEADFSMPSADLMYRDLFGVEGIRAENPYFEKHSLKKAISAGSNHEELRKLLEEIIKRYDAMQPAPFDYPGNSSG